GAPELQCQLQVGGREDAAVVAAEARLGGAQAADFGVDAARRGAAAERDGVGLDRCARRERGQEGLPRDVGRVGRGACGSRERENGGGKERGTSDGGTPAHTRIIPASRRFSPLCEQYPLPSA